MIYFDIKIMRENLMVRERRSKSLDSSDVLESKQLLPYEGAQPN